MKFTFKPRHNSHDNDCWCDAIALLTEQNYDVVYKLFKKFINDDGTLMNGFTKSYLLKEDYAYYEFEGSLYTCMQLINTSNGVVFEMDNDNGSHVIYVKDNIIYDNIRKVDTLQYYTDHNVVGIYMKIENEYEYL